MNLWYTEVTMVNLLWYNHGFNRVSDDLRRTPETAPSSSRGSIQPRVRSTNVRATAKVYGTWFANTLLPASLHTNQATTNVLQCCQMVVT